MTRKEAIRQTEQENRLLSLGISREDAESLRRISMRLHSWYEKECGDGNGAIERDEDTDKTYWHNAYTGQRFPIRDDERGAERRLRAIMARYAPLSYYLQGDPRGAVLYIIRPGDAPDGADVASYYNRGICVW